MAAKQKHGDDARHSEAESKLSRLLETENALELMLQEAKDKANALLSAAEAEAARLLEECERELEEGNGGLRERVAHERDRVIASIRGEAQQETGFLDDLDDARVQEAARHVLALLIGARDSRSPR